MTDSIPDEKALLASYEALEELKKLQSEIINMDWTETDKDGKDSESILFQKFGVMVSVLSRTSIHDNTNRFYSSIHIKSKRTYSTHIWKALLDLSSRGSKTSRKPPLRIQT